METSFWSHQVGFQQFSFQISGNIKWKRPSFFFKSLGNPILKYGFCSSIWWILEVQSLFIIHMATFAIGPINDAQRCDAPPAASRVRSGAESSRHKQ